MGATRSQSGPRGGASSAAPAACLEPSAVLACGGGWLALDKPAGVSVHNAPGADLLALAAGALGADPLLAARCAWNPAFGLHPVNRLDRDTSGVVLLACSPEALKDLAVQFASGRVVKRYLAVLLGHLAAGEERWGLWDWPLNPRSAGGGQPRGAPPHVACRTRWRVLAYQGACSLVVCEPLTGRTHQIRRHCRLAGHPVAGDRRYGLRNTLAGRLALHALALRLTPPGAPGPVTLRSHAIPNDLLELLGSAPPQRGTAAEFIDRAMETMPS
jgi:23S rRNA-/tRNA-specific pseudouridylate synthase